MKRFTIAVLSVALASCGKSEDPQANAVHDYTKPMLTEQNVAGLIKCLNENKKASEFMYGQGVKTAAQFEEFNDLVKKYGFSGRYEFLYAKSHCDAAETYLKHCDMFDPRIAKKQEELKKPDLAEGVRKELESDLALLNKQRESSTRPPDADVEALKKHRAAYQEADKKARGN